MKIVSSIKYVFLVVGASLLAVGLTFYQSSSQFAEQAVTVQGKVVDYERSRSNGGVVYKAVVEYPDGNGGHYQLLTSVASNPPAYKIGEPVDVLHPPGQPQDAKLEGFLELWGVASLMGALGGSFFAVGAILWLIGTARRRNKAVLAASGACVAAAFKSVELNGAFSVNGRHPFVIVCHWLDPQSGTLHVFQSEHLWYDPSQFIDRKTIDVYIQPDDPGKYYMDVSFLPKVVM